MFLAKHWRQKGPYYRLEGQRNNKNGEVRFPARPATLAEQPEDWETCSLSGRGEIYSFSVIRQAPSGFEQDVPYPVR